MQDSEMLFPVIDLMDDPAPRGAAINMAVDETLLRDLPRPLLRVYRWANEAVSFGYFEKFEAILAEFPKRELVRRWTGGGVVPHGKDLTYSLLVPVGDRFLKTKPADSYCVIHRVVAEVLGTEGEKATVVAVDAPKISQACFENPVQHDVVASDSRKIAGAAQRRTRDGLLHQGSIQSIALSAAFGERLAYALGGEIRRRMLTDEELNGAEALATGKYATDAWMRRC